MVWSTLRGDLRTFLDNKNKQIYELILLLFVEPLASLTNRAVSGGRIGFSQDCRPSVAGRNFKCSPGSMTKCFSVVFFFELLAETIMPQIFVYVSFKLWLLCPIVQSLTSKNIGTNCRLNSTLNNHC